MSTDLVPTEQGERPRWMVPAEGTPDGVAELGRIVRPSMMKIIQGQSNSEIRDQFGVGSIVLMPDLHQLSGPDESIRICPLMFYTEYCKWSSFRLKGIEPTIVDRSFDPKSTVAIKSQSPATWSEPHPNYPNDEKYMYRYCEHTNFIVKLMDEVHLDLDPVIISFTRTNYKVGSRFAKMILARRAAIYAGIYKLGTRTQQGQGNDWKIYSMDDSEQMWIGTPELYERMKDAHLYYSKLMKSKTLDVQYADLDEVNPEDIVDVSTY